MSTTTTHQTTPSGPLRLPPASDVTPGSTCSASVARRRARPESPRAGSPELDAARKEHLRLRGRIADDVAILDDLVAAFAEEDADHEAKLRDAARSDRRDPVEDERTPEDERQAQIDDVSAQIWATVASWPTSLRRSSLSSRAGGSPARRPSCSPWRRRPRHGRRSVSLTRRVPRDRVSRRSASAFSRPPTIRACSVVSPPCSGPGAVRVQRQSRQGGLDAPVASRLALHARCSGRPPGRRPASTCPTSTISTTTRTRTRSSRRPGRRHDARDARGRGPVRRLRAPELRRQRSAAAPPPPAAPAPALPSPSPAVPAPPQHPDLHGGPRVPADDPAAEDALVDAYLRANGMK